MAVRFPGVPWAVPLPDPLWVVSAWKDSSSPWSPVVSERERQILFQVVQMQVTGENLLTIHIPKSFCSLAPVCDDRHIQRLSVVQHVWGHVDAPVVATSVPAVAGTAGPESPVNCGARTGQAYAFPVTQRARQPFPWSREEWCSLGLK